MKRINKILFFISIVIVVVVLLNFIVMKVQRHNILNYLNNKYGNDDFNIVNIKKDYSYYGIISKDHTGYEVTISSPMLKQTFLMYIDGTNRLKMGEVTEYFLKEYYNQNINEYLSQKYDLNFDIWLENEKIPNDCGHIPTLNELADFNAIDEIYINVYKNNNFVYDDDLNGRINYLKNLSYDLINYLDISRNVNITFYRWANLNSFSYTIEITENTIKIINDSNNEINVFNINEL